MIMVTGGCGFIGANFIRAWLAAGAGPVINIDALTYAGNPENLQDYEQHPDYRFERLDITDHQAVRHLILETRPRAIIHFAAESHVDRSIAAPEGFLSTNVMGTFNLLMAALELYRSGSSDERQAFRFLHVSTDEVYGTLSADEPAFTERHPYQPNSPYSASKAASDHLVRAWYHTYGLPVLTTNCSNNYGPYQFPEKLIPLMIERALAGETLPVYGDGSNVRDWLFVEDHCSAICRVLEAGRLGETYNIGGNAERTNLQVVTALSKILQELRPRDGGYEQLIRFVSDRPGHDLRYAINADKIRSELGWEPSIDFDRGLRHTVSWYLDNRSWVERVKSGEYQQWLGRQYGQADES